MAIQSNFPSLKPTLLLDFANTKQLDPRITFTRASTATYYDGKTVAMAEQNLLLYSQQLDQSGAWGVTGGAVSANSTSAPDGTTTAETLTADTSTGLHVISQISSSIAGTQRAFSFFVKANTHNFVQLAFNTDTQAFANFNVTAGAGAVGTVGSAATAAIVDAGNGWYRCSIITSSATAGTTVYAFIVSSATSARFQSWTTAGTESIYLWGAQLEQRSAVTAYTATTTAPITNYIPVLQTAASGVARFEHNPVTGESLGLEIEEQRTNLLTYSEEFDNAAWTKAQSSITANTIVSPAGTLTGDKLVENTATADHAFRGDATISAGATISFSIYAKAAERTNIRLQFADTASTNQTLAFFNLSDGTTSGLSQTGSATLGAASVTAVGNGWYRCVLTGRIDGSATTARCRVSLADASSNISYTGNGFAGAFIWGAQLEAGAFATSYIPTVASQVTRSADSASMTGTNFSSWYAADQGTLFFNGSTYNTSSPTMLTVSNGTATGEILQLNQTSGGAVRFEVRNGGTSQASITTSVTAVANTAFFTAAAYKVNDFAAASNSGMVGTDTSGTTPVPDSLRLMQSGSGGTIFNGTIRKIAYYPLRVTNAQLQSLTTV